MTTHKPCPNHLIIVQKTLRDFFAPQKTVAICLNFRYDAHNKALRDFETLQVSPSKFLATPKTSLNAMRYV